MSDLRELYREVILDHSRHPRNFGHMEQPSHKAEGYNPLCGDRVTLYLRLEDGVVREAGFEGSGCAISTASASMLTEALRGKTAEEARKAFDEFHGLLTGESGAQPDPETLGKLAVFSGVREFPMRVKCATLAWHTMRAALENRDEPVTTE